MSHVKCSPEKIRDEVKKNKEGSNLGLENIFINPIHHFCGK